MYKMLITPQLHYVPSLEVVISAMSHKSTVSQYDVAHVWGH